MKRLGVLLLLLGIVAIGASFASAASIGTVTVQSVTSYSAASTVPTSSCSSNPTQVTTINAQQKTKNFVNTLTITFNGTKPAYGLVQFSPCATANAYVVSASFGATIATAPSATRTWGVFPITSAWTASTVTWASTPTISGTASATQATGAAGSTMTWSPVAADVQGWVNGGANDGWAIEDTGSTFDTGTLTPTGGSAPLLSIVYYP